MSNAREVTERFRSSNLGRPPPDLGPRSRSRFRSSRHVRNRAPYSDALERAPNATGTALARSREDHERENRKHQEALDVVSKHRVACFDGSRDGRVITRPRVARIRETANTVVQVVRCQFALCEAPKQTCFSVGVFQGRLFAELLHVAPWNSFPPKRIARLESEEVFRVPADSGKDLWTKLGFY